MKCLLKSPKRKRDLASPRIQSPVARRLLSAPSVLVRLHEQTALRWQDLLPHLRDDAVPALPGQGSAGKGSALLQQITVDPLIPRQTRA